MFKEYDNGFYVGEFQDEKRHGSGKYTWNDGRSYAGEWKNDNLHGEGVFTFADGGKYVGKFEDNREAGGWHHFPDGSKKWVIVDAPGRGVKSTGSAEQKAQVGHDEASSSADCPMREAKSVIPDSVERNRTLDVLRSRVNWQGAMSATAAERQRILDSNDPVMLRALADQGDAEAAFRLGLLNPTPTGASQNTTKLPSALAKAAEAGLQLAPRSGDRRMEPPMNGVPAKAKAKNKYLPIAVIGLCVVAAIAGTLWQRTNLAARKRDQAKIETQAKAQAAAIAEAQLIAAKKAAAEENARLAAEAKAKEEAEAEAKRIMAEQARKAEEMRKSEEARKAEEARKRLAEEQRLAEQKAEAEAKRFQQAKADEEAKAAEAEAARLAEATKQAAANVQAAERNRILDSNDPVALKTLGGQGDGDAAFKLGHLYMTATGVTQNYAEAAKWFRTAAEAGNSDAENILGQVYAEGVGDKAEAIKWYRKAAEAGNSKGQVNLGLMYENGIGVEKNNVEAIKWYRKAAEAGNPTGQHNLGLMYVNGLGVEKDAAEALSWFRKAAEAGNSDGQNDLGFMYRNGIGVEKNAAEALNWFRKAAEAGNSTAQNNLGFMCENGIGVEKDKAEAINWYRKAADAGNPEARKNLERMVGAGKQPAQKAQGAEGGPTARLAVTNFSRQNGSQAVLKLYREGLWQTGVGVMSIDGTPTTTSISKAKRINLPPGEHVLVFGLVNDSAVSSYVPITENVTVEAGKTYTANMLTAYRQPGMSPKQGKWAVAVSGDNEKGGSNEVKWATFQFR